MRALRCGPTSSFKARLKKLRKLHAGAESLRESLAALLKEEREPLAPYPRRLDEKDRLAVAVRSATDEVGATRRQRAEELAGLLRRVEKLDAEIQFQVIEWATPARR